MLYVRIPLSFKSKRRIELLIYNQFQTTIPQSPQFHKSLQLAVGDETVVVFYTFSNNWKTEIRCWCAISL